MPQFTTAIFKCLMYADDTVDTTLFSTGRSFETHAREDDLDTIIDNELLKISEWLRINNK